LSLIHVLAYSILEPVNLLTNPHTFRSMLPKLREKYGFQTYEQFSGATQGPAKKVSENEAN
jgi:hypothetical protein